MRSDLKAILAVGAAAGLASTAVARPIFPEVEPNDSKAAANAVPLDDGDGVSGTSTGTSTITPGLASADYFRIRNVARPAGVYRHRLTLTVTGTSFNTATIRGLNQVAAAAAPWPGPVGTAGTTDTTIQTGSSVLAASARTVQWYGFGKQEELYYRVTGSTGTTGEYTAVLSTEPVAVVDLGTFAVGAITLNSMNQTTGDTEFWVYDSNFDAIPGWGNDDNSTLGGGTGVGLQSILTRDYTAGVYYIAVSTFNLCNDQGSPCDDDFRTGAMLDFPHAVANSSTSLNVSTNFQISDSGGASQVVVNSHANAFDVNWFKITVGAAGCYPDCNNDNLLNIADFGCFQTKFALQDPYADCNGDTFFNLADFGCFQTKFALGCP